YGMHSHAEHGNEVSGGFCDSLLRGKDGSGINQHLRPFATPSLCVGMHSQPQAPYLLTGHGATTQDPRA
nr:hypothetical protein [Endozoicomonas sp.]